MSPRDVSASVRARLLNNSKRNSEAFDLVLVRFAIERLLYRLSKSKFRDRFVVKGAMMIQVWTRLTSPSKTLLEQTQDSRALEYENPRKTVLSVFARRYSPVAVPRVDLSIGAALLTSSE